MATAFTKKAAHPRLILNEVQWYLIKINSKDYLNAPTRPSTTPPPTPKTRILRVGNEIGQYHACQLEGTQ